MTNIGENNNNFRNKTLNSHVIQTKFLFYYRFRNRFNNYK